MKPSRIAALFLVLTAVLIASACGGGGKAAKDQDSDKVATHGAVLPEWRSCPLN